MSSSKSKHSDRAQRLRKRERKIKEVESKFTLLREKAVSEFEKRKWKEASESFTICMQYAKEILDDPQSNAKNKKAMSEALPLMYCNRSHCHIKSWNYVDARLDAIEAIKLDPNNPKGYFRLALSLEYLARAEKEDIKNISIKTQAEEAYKQCIKLYKDTNIEFPDAQAGLNRLLNNKEIETDKLERLCMWIAAGGGTFP